MEQRIGSSSQPLDGAGIDPAFIPGLTSPVSEDPEDVKPEKAEEPEKAESPAEASEEAVEDAPDEPPASEEPESAEEESEEEEAPDGPVFEASDRRARMIADHSGVRLFLDDQECEFRWDEIGAVETESPRFGKRFTITVHTPDRRWFPIEIEATARSRFKEWEEQLDAVLDAYFEDAEDAEESD
ncbi:hypothetical protein [Streptomyces sp. GESEQ-35]|uniref:hypothetical protein n=1 Tax=Streptomyces sp. GESEQ-35 TaxID=2812657 RepID=UPI001B33A02E|nr:hypothetical protein [Streptomyces sp. GESEQ-35]